MDKMLKRELIPIVLSLQNETTEDNNTMLQEMRNFNDNFAKLQAELVVTKRVSSELCKRIVTVERQCWANAPQYSRRGCLEVAGIPRQVDDKNLETKVLSIFQKIGCTIDPTFIDDCPKDWKQILKVKKDLRNIDMEDLDLPRAQRYI